MRRNVVNDVVKECKISKRKAEEMLKISLFYGDTYSEAKESIRNFTLKNF